MYNDSHEIRQRCPSHLVWNLKKKDKKKKKKFIPCEMENVLVTGVA